MKSRKYDAALTGYYGFGNLGDELLAEAFCNSLQRCGVSKKRIAFLAGDRQNYQKSLGCDTYRRMKDAVKVLKQSKILIFGGGGVFQDSSSAVSCVYYFVLALIARICGAKVAFAGQSVGPFHSFVGRMFSRAAFMLASSVSVRDEISADIVRSFGIKCNIVPDFVMSLEKRELKPGEPVIIFNARSGYDTARTLACDVCNREAKNRNLPVVGIALSDEDKAELEKIEKENIIKFEKVVKVSSYDEFCDAVAGAVCAVGMRLHFLVLSSMLGLPCAGAAYDPKITGFCKASGIALCGEDCVPKKADASFIASARQKCDESIKEILCSNR